MATMAFQSLHRAECICRPLDGLIRGNVAEVGCGQIGEQPQAHIRRRGAMTDDKSRMLLNIIRRQPMIFRAHERFKECPSLTGKLLKETNLINSKRWSARSER